MMRLRKEKPNNLPGDKLTASAVVHQSNDKRMKWLNNDKENRAKIRTVVELHTTARDRKHTDFYIIYSFSNGLIFAHSVDRQTAQC